MLAYKATKTNKIFALLPILPKKKKSFFPSRVYHNPKKFLLQISPKSSFKKLCDKEGSKKKDCCWFFFVLMIKIVEVYINFKALFSIN